MNTSMDDIELSAANPETASLSVNEAVYAYRDTKRELVKCELRLKQLNDQVDTLMDNYNNRHIYREHFKSVVDVSKKCQDDYTSMKENISKQSAPTLSDKLRMEDLYFYSEVSIQRVQELSGWRNYSDDEYLRVIDSNAKYLIKETDNIKKVREKLESAKISYESVVSIARSSDDFC